MSKFYGRVGYVHNEEIRPGVYQEVATTRKYKGDLTQILKRTQTEGDVNASLSVSNEVSIIADPFARENFHMIRYVEYQNSKWTVNSVQVRYPRLLLTLGGIYNGPFETRAPDDP